MNFGADGATLFPPPAEQLAETARCPRCQWEGTAYVWPLVASLGTGSSRVEQPVGRRRVACPTCGLPLDPRRRHPSAG